MSDVRDVAAAVDGAYEHATSWACDECDEHYPSPRAAIMCADRDRAEDASNRRILRSTN